MPITNNAKTLLQQKRNNWQSVFGVRIASSLLLALFLFACKPATHNVVSSSAAGGAQGSYGTEAYNKNSKESAVPLKGGLTEKILLTAYSQIGKGYRFGGTSPISGFDCSGFTRWVYAQNGINLPRSSREQLQMGRPIAKSDLRPGDLVIYKRYRKTSATHVGIYVGNGKYIHSPRAGYSIEVSDAFGSSTGPRFIGARRVFDDPRACPLTNEQAASARRLMASISKNDSDDSDTSTFSSDSSYKSSKHHSKKSKKGSKSSRLAKGSNSKGTMLASAEKNNKKSGSANSISKKSSATKSSKKSKSSGSVSESSPKKKKSKRS